MLAALLSALAVAIAPPSAPGSWKQLGAVVTSKPAKLAHYFRTTSQPTAFAVVATSSSAKPIRLTWFDYCSVMSDEGMNGMSGQQQGTITGMRRVVAYPPVVTGADNCTVVVTIRVNAGRASSAVFSY